MALGGATMGVTTSDQTNLHTDSLPNALNTNKSVPTNNCILFTLNMFFFNCEKRKLSIKNTQYMRSEDIMNDKIHTT